MQNTGKLIGKTIFISGASRGIGKAIALKCARDGANVVIAAKTTEPHPKLPGTIYTAAKEVEDAGGKCLPCVVDIQNEGQIKQAVEEAADKFGGIDILVNNASAIHGTGTLETPMKKYDLMMNVNTRGTFLCSKYCLPYLKEGKNPHILNISPPLSMSPKWFKGHVAYTMAKYGMSMCVLGMAEEFKENGIAVNALWPRTAIYTAAMAMLGGGDAIKSQCRDVSIMSDAAYAIFQKENNTFTGQFAIDDDILHEAGIADLEQYACVPGSTLLPDFFIETDADVDSFADQIEQHGGKAAFKDGKHQSAVPQGGNTGTLVETTFDNVKKVLSADLVKSVNGVYAFDLKEDGQWFLDLKTDSGSVGTGSAPGGDAGCTFVMSGEDFVKMFQGQLNPTTAFMSGQLKIKGDLGLAMKLEKLMKQAR